MAPVDVCQMVLAGMRCSSLLDEITKRCPCVVIVADVDEYWLHDHTRYLLPLRTEAVKWILPPRIIRERSAAMGLDYFISPACGLLLWFSQISIGRTLTRVVDTVPPGSAGRGRHS